MRIALPPLVIVALATILSCSTPTVPVKAEEARMESWRVAVGSSGGFTGRGNGGMVFNSDGRGTVSTIGASREVTLTESERARIGSALQRAMAGEWSSPPDPKQGADMIVYTLSADYGAKHRDLRWREDVRDQLSPDLLALVNLLFDVRNDALKNS
jgi:hypothetical protein